MGTSWNTGDSLRTSGNTSLLWESPSAGTGSPKRFWSLHPWRYLKAVQVTGSGWHCLSGEGMLDKMTSRSPTSTTPWVCESVLRLKTFLFRLLEGFILQTTLCTQSKTSEVWNHIGQWSASSKQRWPFLQLFEHCTSFLIHLLHLTWLHKAGNNSFSALVFLALYSWKVLAFLFTTADPEHQCMLGRRQYPRVPVAKVTKLLV